MEARCLASRMERAIEVVRRVIRRVFVVGAFVRPGVCIVSFQLIWWCGMGG